MNMLGKTIEISQLSTSTLTNRSDVTVTVFEDFGSGIMRNVGTFKLTFDRAYNAIDDGSLMPDIIAKLETLP